MTPTAIRTFSGKVFDFADPRPEAVCIEDIAHGLANCCRFCGQARAFYSVAQHSVIVADLAARMNPAMCSYSADLELAGLLHDASEAYTGDVVTPLKTVLPDFRAIEAAVTAAVTAAFGIDYLPLGSAEAIKAADREALAIEGKLMMPGREDEFGAPRSTLFLTDIWAPVVAEAAFLNRFNELIARRAL